MVPLGQDDVILCHFDLKLCKLFVLVSIFSNKKRDSVLEWCRKRIFWRSFPPMFSAQKWAPRTCSNSHPFSVSYGWSLKSSKIDYRAGAAETSAAAATISWWGWVRRSAKNWDLWICQEKPFCHRWHFRRCLLLLQGCFQYSPTRYDSKPITHSKTFQDHTRRIWNGCKVVFTGNHSRLFLCLAGIIIIRWSTWKNWK